MNRITFAALASASLAAGALSTAVWAQTAQQSQQAPRPAGPAQVMKPVQYYTQHSEDQRASRIIGATVRNNQNESVGEVEDLIMDKSGAVKAAIVSVGGFLGIGERWVAVHYESLAIQPDGANLRVALNTTRDQLKGAPEFKYENNWARNRGPNTTATTPARGSSGAPMTPAPSMPAPAERSPAPAR